jgi:hypothetical protein
MNEPFPPATPQAPLELSRERTKQASIAAWTAGLSAFFCVGALVSNPTWPVAAGVAAIVGMVMVISVTILLRR